MEHPWRPRPASGNNFCPVCSYSHFPFCPPPPVSQYYPPPPPPPPDQFPNHFAPRQPPPPLYPPPPPPPPPQSSYDPFVDPYAPPLAQTPTRPWISSSPNFNNVKPGLDYYDNNSQIKRVRYEIPPPPANSVAVVAEDERRLKLIRDHGGRLERNYDGDYKFFTNSNSEVRNVGDQFIGNGAGYRQDSNVQVKRKFGETQFAHQHWENSKNSEMGRLVHDNQCDSFVQNQGYANYISGHKVESHYDSKQSVGNHEVQAYKNATFQEQRSNFAMQTPELNGHLLLPKQRAMEPNTTFYNISSPHNNVHSHGPFKGQPPLPNSPPPPLPVERPGFHFPGPAAPSSTSGSSLLFPIAVDSSSSRQSPYVVASQPNTQTTIQYSSNANPKPSDYYAKEFQAVQTTSSSTYFRESEEFPKRHPSLDKPKVIDASLILKHPHRSTRPDHIVVILRGLPGSGKSYLAKLLRDLEVENGGSAPRIHSMDDYFMTEVEKAEESEGSKSSGSARGKKPVMKKVMEYFYEPEMEEAYRSSMLKAFKKTLDEGVFSFVIVDDRNLRVADFAQFWATAKRSGYEVYLLEAAYKDPAGCAARNVHCFTLNDIQKMANQWEETPSLYMILDIKSILHGSDLEENKIQEVDMDMEDGSHIASLSASEDADTEKIARSTKGPSNDEHKWDVVEEHPVELAKELGKSKWSNDLDEEDSQKTGMSKRKPSPSSDLVNSYSKKGKSLRWADQVGKIGFSIGAGRTSNVSLVIGPGSGYNLKSNPLPEEEKITVRSSELRKGNIFQQQLRAERESFRAVFDKRRHRISGLEADEE